MKLIIEGYNKTIHKKDNQILIKEKDDEIYRIPAKKISDITILGKGHITFDALSLLSKYDIKLISINYYGQIEYVLQSPSQKDVNLKKEQYKASKNQKGIEIAIEIIKSKIKNQRSTLKTLNKNKNYPEISEIEKNIKKAIKELDQLEFENNNLIKNQIMGIEGRTSFEYWKGISQLLPEKINFKQRDQSPKKDVVNAMLNYGYAILASEITKNIVIKGLDPYCGILLPTDIKEQV